MTGRYKAYPEYKKSGVEWLGEIPADWVMSKLAYTYTQTNAGEVIDKNYWGSGKETLYTCNRNYLRCDYLIFPNKKRTTKQDLLLTRNGTPYVHKPIVNAIYSNVVQRITLQGRFDRDYLAYCLSNSALNLKGYGVSIESLNFENWQSLSFAYPIKEEQKKIAYFLDHETAKIDTLITKQEKLIELLKEKRQAVISHAVTKGLNPDAPMKDSGVEWLGEVPEHWVITSLKRFINKMEQGKSPECDSSPAPIEHWGVLKTSCVNNAKFDPTANKMLPPHIEPHSKYEVKGGDILMSRASGSINLIGSVAKVQNDVRTKILLSDKVFRLYLTSLMKTDFFVYLMASNYVRTLVENAISGAEGMANNITKSAIMDFTIPVPPIKEQKLMETELEKQVNRFDILVAKAESANILIKERKTSLISAAVTGKIDVRNWQPQTEVVSGE